MKGLNYALQHLTAVQNQMMDNLSDINAAREVLEHLYDELAEEASMRNGETTHVGWADAIMDALELLK